MSRLARRVLAATAVAALLVPAVPASANPICDLEHCILRGVCERLGGIPCDQLD